jgi:hypothetical protein
MRVIPVETIIIHPQFMALLKGPAMTMPLDAPEILNREFIEVRHRLIQVAATLDRLARAEGEVAGDPRLALVQEALDILKSTAADRAEQIQILFSRPYDEQWQARYFS